MNYVIYFSLNKNILKISNEFKINQQKKHQKLNLSNKPIHIID